MIKPKFNSQKLKSDLNKRIERINNAIVMRLEIIGEEFVNNARLKTVEQKGFRDFSGNLRSSIGYIVMFQGKIVTASTFDHVLNGGEGSSNGKRYIRKIAAKYKENGFVLIGVAGMHYAAAVESKGKDVITGSSLIAIEQLKTALNKIKNKVNKN